jgi:hypothetical protein
LYYLKLVGGQYEEQVLQPQNPHLWLDVLGIGLGIWEGSFDEVSAHWLRWCDREGNWLLTDTEQAQLEIEQAQLKTKQVQAQLHQTAQNLLATGMDMKQIAQILGLSELQMQNFDQEKD